MEWSATTFRDLLGLLIALLAAIPGILAYVNSARKLRQEREAAATAAEQRAEEITHDHEEEIRRAYQELSTTMQERLDRIQQENDRLVEAHAEMRLEISSLREELAESQRVAAMYQARTSLLTTRLRAFGETVTWPGEED